VDRFIECRKAVATAAHRGNEADGAGQRGRFVAENIAKQISGEDYVELRRLEHDLHRGVIHVEVLDDYARVIGRDAGNGLAPKTGCREDIGFVNTGQASIPGFRAGKGITSDAFDFRDGIFRNIPRVGFGASAVNFVRAEINIAGQLTDDFEITIGDAVAPVAPVARPVAPVSRPAPTTPAAPAAPPASAALPAAPAPPAAPGGLGAAPGGFSSGPVGFGPGSAPATGLSSSWDLASTDVFPVATDADSPPQAPGEPEASVPEDDPGTDEHGTGEHGTGERGQGGSPGS